MKPRFGPSSAFLMNIFFALKGSELFLFLFVITSAGVVSCGGRKKVSPHPSLVQIIFYVWSFQIKECILRIPKYSYIWIHFQNNVLIFRYFFDLYQS